MRARALVVVVFLLSYGAVGARQPAVRMGVPLPAPDFAIAQALDIPVVDRSRFVLDVVRVIFGAGPNESETQQRASLQQLLAASRPAGEAVPLPLDAAVWRETILQQQIPDAQIINVILSQRATALLYSALQASTRNARLARVGARHAPPALTACRRICGLRPEPSHTSGQGGRARRRRSRANVAGDRRRRSRQAGGVRAAAVRRRIGSLAWFYDTLSGLDDRDCDLPGRIAARRGASGRVRALLEVFERADRCADPREAALHTPAARPGVDACRGRGGYRWDTRRPTRSASGNASWQTTCADGPRCRRATRAIRIRRWLTQRGSVAHPQRAGGCRTKTTRRVPLRSAQVSRTSLHVRCRADGVARSAPRLSLRCC